MDWFQIDKAGLAAVLERRGKSFVLFELLSNAWDSGASRVDVRITPIPGAAFARIEIIDDGEGFADLADAFTMFARSRRGADSEKRGRFALGEKLVLACCRSASITSTTGTVLFDDGGRRVTGGKVSKGTWITAEVRMTREELGEVLDAARRIVPPVPTFLDNAEIPRPALLATFRAKLPTEAADAQGVLRRSVRLATVEAFEPVDGTGEILEMGVPVCSADFPWRLNVLQKVPLGMERDSVTDAFRRALQVAAVNALAATINQDQAAAPWASEALGDARLSADAVREVVSKRFGDRAVVAVPGDPIANAQAEAMGCVVIHGGALSGDAWANLRKHATIPTTSQAFPTPKPTADASAVQTCPLCKRPVSA